METGLLSSCPGGFSQTGSGHLVQEMCTTLASPVTITSSTSHTLTQLVLAAAGKGCDPPPLTEGMSETQRSSDTPQANAADQDENTQGSGAGLGLSPPDHLASCCHCACPADRTEACSTFQEHDTRYKIFFKQVHSPCGVSVMFLPRCSPPDC
ncbi:hypothetical protein KIL84_004647 [Mauremys mutica]|uniref:Uncharacterized protein n=1 Tax=Mauremys mutica TaxID=74926 RepID=A0A9D3XQ34_9SAUR|nr:hypothetical protein KIL84_004647 [Mauremys mutica]